MKMYTIYFPDSGQFANNQFTSKKKHNTFDTLSITSLGIQMENNSNFIFILTIAKLILQLLVIYY